MRKTTEELEASLSRMAEEQHRSEAELIRKASEDTVSSRNRPRPKIPLTGKSLEDPTISERVNELLEGLGRS